MEIIALFIIAISLSMDAFSLSLIYGTGKINNKDKLLLSIIVGTYHFIMPLIGLLIGNIIIKKINFNPNIVVGIILSLIGLEMIISSFKGKKETFLYSTYGFLIFGLSVSIDSLTTGIGLMGITSLPLVASIIFALTSFSFTYLGLNIGNFISIKYGNIATIIGGIILILVGLFYIFWI